MSKRSDQATALRNRHRLIINIVRQIMGLDPLEPPTQPPPPVITSVTGVVPGQIGVASVVTINGTGTSGGIVKVFSNGTLLGFTSVSGGGTWAFTTPSLASGETKITTTQTVNGTESDPCEI